MQGICHKGKENYRGSGVYTFDSLCGLDNLDAGDSIANLWVDVDCAECLKHEPTDKNRIRNLESELTALKAEMADYREALEKVSDATNYTIGNPDADFFSDIILDSEEKSVWTFAREILAKHDKHKGERRR